MADFKFGDMICYKGSVPLGHGEPIMYLGPCNHSDPRDGPTRWLAGDIDMLSIPYGIVDHKDPAMWDLCRHLVDADGYLPGENPKDHGITDSFSREDPEMSIRVFYGHRDVTDRVQIETIGSGAVQITSDLDGPFEIIYEPAP